MGPSGSGKTTLLSILGGRAPRCLLQGRPCAFSYKTGALFCISCAVPCKCAACVLNYPLYVCSALTMKGWPTFNREKLTKRAKRQVGFVLQVG